MGFFFFELTRDFFCPAVRSFFFPGVYITYPASIFFGVLGSFLHKKQFWDTYIKHIQL